MMRAQNTTRALALFYKLARSALFQLDPESSHRLTFKLLRARHAIPGASLLTCPAPELPTNIMGLAFKNPVGLAAGLDKNAECVGPFADVGFGSLELGTVTPRAQAGNPSPRLFRLIRDRALINRMGFPNEGLDAFLANLAQWGKPCPLGINIGKNKDTPNERALEDYLAALRAVYPHADYVAVNISSPNTPGLRELQGGQHLDLLLGGLQAERLHLAAQHKRTVPIALKIAPDLTDEQIAEIAQMVLRHGFDAVIATNTTLTRPALDQEPLAKEAGGLSGAPLKALSTAVVKKLYAQLRGKVPIIGVGGIENAEDAWEKLVAGADAIQIYTAFIYEGPDIVRDIVDGLRQKISSIGATTLAEALKRARSET
jgi:dihydroorotate dehydrogenase